MIKIVNCTIGDTKNLFELFNEWDKSHSFDFDVFSDSLNKILKEEYNKIFLAVEDNNIAGYVQMYKCHELGFDSYYEVVQLLVSGNKRNSGIGKLLMKKVEDTALKDNIKTIKLSSQVHRTNAHVFYENIGYEYYKISKFYEKKLI